jgi:hypothetical protein
MVVRSKQSLLTAIALLVIALAGCSKGGTSLNEDANKPREKPRPADEMPCGNDQIDDGEDCDGDMMGDATCTTLGFAGGVLACDPITCTYETSMCRLPPSLGTAGTSASGS